MGKESSRSRSPRNGLEVVVEGLPNLRDAMRADGHQWRPDDLADVGPERPEDMALFRWNVEIECSNSSGDQLDKKLTNAKDNGLRVLGRPDAWGNGPAFTDMKRD